MDLNTLVLTKQGRLLACLQQNLLYWICFC